MTSIGLYGGRFDPVHRGHLALARAAMNQFNLALLYIVPVYQPPHRPNTTAAFEHRLAMARVAFADWPKVIVSDLEEKRGGISYTVETIDELRRLHPDRELCLLVGADTAEEISMWKEPKRLARLVRLLVAPRPGSAPYLEPEWRCEQIRMQPMDVSATAIRQAIRDGRPIRELVTDTIAEYIDRHRLYRSS